MSAKGHRMVWAHLGSYIAMLDEPPELYSLDGRWVEVLTDPPDPKPYCEVEVSAEVAPGMSYWLVTEDITDIAVSRIDVTPDMTRHRRWLTVPKSVLGSRRQMRRIRQAFTLAGEQLEPTPRFLGTRLLRAPSG
jgi:hypothetical protein